MSSSRNIQEVLLLKKFYQLSLKDLNAAVLLIQTCCKRDNFVPYIAYMKYPTAETWAKCVAYVRNLPEFQLSCDLSIAAWAAMISASASSSADASTPTS